MKHSYIRLTALATLALLPVTTFAQLLSLNPAVDGWREAMLKFIYLINFFLIPLLFGIGMLFFLWNIFRYAVASGDQKARDKAKRQMLYGIGGFVVLVCFWGIVNLLVSGLGLAEDEVPCNDFITDYAGFSLSDC